MLELTILSQTVPAMTPSASMPMGQMHNGAAGSKDMQVSMMMGMDGMQKMPMSGDTDKDFATMMKMHHQQAVNMSEMGAGKRQIAGDENLGQDDHPAMKAVFALHKGTSRALERSEACCQPLRRSSRDRNSHAAVRASAT